MAPSACLMLKDWHDSAVSFTNTMYMLITGIDEVDKGRIQGGQDGFAGGCRSTLTSVQQDPKRSTDVRARFRSANFYEVLIYGSRVRGVSMVWDAEINTE